MSVGTRVLSNRFEVPAVLALGVEWVVLLISSVRNVQGTGDVSAGDTLLHKCSIYPFIFGSTRTHCNIPVQCLRYIVSSPLNNTNSHTV